MLMISIDKAKDIIRSNSKTLSPVKTALQKAAGLILSEDVYAPIDIPPFHQSSMDGYAFYFDDYVPGKKLSIVGEVAAGSDKTFNDLPQQAVRIFTGAPVPAGADTIVMQEKVNAENGTLMILDEQLQRGINVRLKGFEIKAGSVALKKDIHLSPAAIGFLAGIGITEVKAYPHPRITIIVTGKELQQPGQTLQPGQTYESNSFTLKAALQQLHIIEVDIISVDDDLNILQQAINAALQGSDLILLTGGISVGDYDYVLEAVTLCGITKQFHRVKQRPGKPLFFGTKDQQLIFGLPGNPSSVLTCFYEYVILALENLTGRKNIITKKQLPLSDVYSKKEGLTHFLKGYYTENKVTPLDAQESYRLQSFAAANCLIVLEEERTEYKEGDMVEVHVLPS